MLRKFKLSCLGLGDMGLGEMGGHRYYTRSFYVLASITSP